MRIIAAAVAALIFASVASAGGIDVRLAAVRGAVWATTGSEVLKIDVRTGRIVSRPRTAYSYPLQVAVGGGAAWIASVQNGFVAGALSRVDLATGRVTTPLRLPHAPVGEIAVGGGAAWAVVGKPRSARVARVGLDGRSVRMLRVGRTPSRVAADRSGLWALDSRAALLHVDPETNAVRTVARLSPGAGPLALGLGSAWVVEGGVLHRLDERTGRTLARIGIGGSPIAVDVGGASAWVLRFDPQSERTRLVRVDARTNRVSGGRSVFGFPSAVSVGAGAVWVGELVPSPRLIRVDPRTLAARTFATLA